MTIKNLLFEENFGDVMIDEEPEENIAEEEKPNEIVFVNLNEGEECKDGKCEDDLQECDDKKELEEKADEPDNAVVDCKVNKVITHSEDEKPLVEKADLIEADEDALDILFNSKEFKKPISDAEVRSYFESKNLHESQSQEIGETYKKLSKLYNVDLEELVYGDDGFMECKYPTGYFPDFNGDLIYSDKYWDEFVEWCKAEKGIELK